MSRSVEPSLEVALVPPAEEGGEGVFPGLYLFTRPARMIRPVLQLATRRTELLGVLEQVRSCGPPPPPEAAGSALIESELPLLPRSRRAMHPTREGHGPCHTL